MTLLVVFMDGMAIPFSNVKDHFFDDDDDTLNMTGDQEDLTVIPRENIRFVSERP